MLIDKATRTAMSATLHCLTGCAIGEILGMIVAAAAGLTNAASIAISVLLAFMFGYALTALPLLRHGLTLKAALLAALAADTISIATMEVSDNAFIAAVPGALDATLSDTLFWVSLAASLVIAFIVTVPVNRYLIGKGKGHATIHHYHHH